MYFIDSEEGGGELTKTKHEKKILPNYINMAWKSGNAFMPVYLLIASIANGAFVIQSIRDLITGNNKSDKVVLFALAISELTWVLPCFIQCFVVFGDFGDGWEPSIPGTGCDVQGFYSVFASVSGQALAVPIARLISKNVRGDSNDCVTTTSLVSALILLCALIFSCLPFMGVGESAFSGEGFCYFDFTDDVHIVLLEFVSLTSMILTVYFYIDALTQVTQATANRFGLSDLNSLKRWILIMLLNHVVAWFLWIPAGFMGSQYDSMNDFPTGYMLTGAIFGHAQALVAPLLYGWIYRSWMMKNYETNSNTTTAKVSLKSHV